MRPGVVAIFSEAILIIYYASIIKYLDLKSNFQEEKYRDWQRTSILS